MTIQHLLCHTAGLTYGGFLPGLELPVDPAYAAAGISRSGADTLEEFVEKLSRVPLLYEPGSRWSYSLATDVCGHLIEVISGQPLETFLKERLFEPLDMPDTGFSVPDEKIGPICRLLRTSARQITETAGRPCHQPLSPCPQSALRRGRASGNHG